MDLISIMPFPNFLNRTPKTEPATPTSEPPVVGDRISTKPITIELGVGCKIAKAPKPEQPLLLDILDGSDKPMMASFPAARFDKYFKTLEDNFGEIDVDGDGKINIGEIFVYEQNKSKAPLSAAAASATDVLNPDLLKRQFTLEEIKALKKEVHGKIVNAAGDDQILTRDEANVANKELNKMIFRPGYIQQHENLIPPAIISDKAIDSNKQPATFK